VAPITNEANLQRLVGSSPLTTDFTGNADAAPGPRRKGRLPLPSGSAF
jgi:hypothetical protein